MPHSGLELNLSKCKLFGPGASCEDPAFDDIPRVSLASGTVVLGVPIGSDEFIATYLEDVCANLAHLAKRIGLLKSAIAKFLLLRACFGTCRINHLLRSLPFEHGRSLSEKTATIVRDNLGHILGSAIPDIHYELACLPMRRGGLGIRNPRLVFGFPGIKPCFW